MESSETICPRVRQVLISAPFWLIRTQTLIREYRESCVGQDSCYIKLRPFVAEAGGEFGFCEGFYRALRGFGGDGRAPF